MRRSTRTLAIVAASALLSTGAVIATSTAASAAVTTNFSFGYLTVTMTGTSSIRPSCAVDGKVLLNQGAAELTTACASVTHLVINGDAGAQGAYDYLVGPSTFPALVSVTANLGDGADFYTTGPATEIVNMGLGADTISASIDSGTDTLSLGNNAGDTAQIEVYGDTPVVATASSPTVTVTGHAGHQAKVSGVTTLTIDGGDEDNSIDASGISATSGITQTRISGNGGNDVITGSPGKDFIDGGDGNDTITGGGGADYLVGGPGTNTIDGGAGVDYYQFGGVAFSPQFPFNGGDTITDPDTGNQWFGAFIQGDNAIRVRQNPATHAWTVASGINHPGLQPLPAGITNVGVNVGTDSSRPVDDRSVVDTVLVPGTQQVYADPTDLVDITAAPGWSTSSVGNATTVETPDHLSIVQVTGGNVLIHAPWSSPAVSFAHRVYRDLLFRYPSAGDRTALAGRIVAGTATYAGTANAIVNSDEYRGIEVDRAYLQYLRRLPDAGGRAYWVGQLAKPISIRALRSLLLASPEYFTTFAGASNATFVTQAYNDVLGRTPDAGGAAYWVGRLNGGALRSTVANAFLATPEARTTIIRSQYVRFLGRVPTAGESSLWSSTLLNHTTGEQELTAFLAGSTDYANRDSSA